MYGAIAQTAAAHFPENGDDCDDGLAPGAQIICMSIEGPEKSSDEEFLQALNKAFLKCIELKVDIVNCSFKSFYGDKKIAELINKMVKEENNILIFKSAGNYGPFYATILKCDSCVEDVIFRIGAALTAEIKQRCYNSPSSINHSPVIFDLSSRGPGSMGSQGLDFAAPGAVITDFPRFSSSQKKYGCYVGTSIATANAAGAVACLLSGLKANSIQYSPASIKFALFKTANLPKNRNKFEFGHGIIQIFDAFDYHCNIDYNNKIPCHLSAAGGIHFMANDDDDENHDVEERETSLFQFIQIEPGKAVTEKWTLKISPKTAEKFIEVRSKIDENNKFNIKFDPKQLEAGSLNFAEILVMDPLIGSIYSIPVNVIKVLKVTETHNYHFEKEITLYFENPHYLILYPSFESCCRKCEIKVTSLENAKLDLCIKYEIEETVKTLNFIPNLSTQTHSIIIENKKIHEFCIFQMTGALSSVMFKIEFNFCQ